MKTAVALKTLLAGMKPAARIAFAKAAKTSAGQLRLVAYGHRTASSALATQIEIASKNLPGDVVVPREGLSPLHCGKCDMLRVCRSGSMQIHQFKVGPAKRDRTSPLSPAGQKLAKRGPKVKRPSTKVAKRALKKAARKIAKTAPVKRGRG